MIQLQQPAKHLPPRRLVDRVADALCGFVEAMPQVKNDPAVDRSAGAIQCRLTASLLPRSAHQRAMRSIAYTSIRTQSSLSLRRFTAAISQGQSFASPTISLMRASVRSPFG